MQIDPCTSAWTRNREGEFVPLWFNGQQFPDELMKPAKQKAPVTQNPVCNEEKPSPPYEFDNVLKIQDINSY